MFWVLYWILVIYHEGRDDKGRLIGHTLAKKNFKLEL